MKNFFKRLFSTKYGILLEDMKKIKDDNSLSIVEKRKKMDETMLAFGKKYGGLK